MLAEPALDLSLTYHGRSPLSHALYHGSTRVAELIGNEVRRGLCMFES